MDWTRPDVLIVSEAIHYSGGARITMAGLSTSIASATHSGSWDETAGKRCWWKNPKPRTSSHQTQPPLCFGTRRWALQNWTRWHTTLKGKIDYERRSVGLRTIDRVDANGVHHGWSLASALWRRTTRPI